jgi:hypothetical protein
VRGQYFIEVTEDYDGPRDAHTNKPLPIPRFHDESEITIHFESSGSFDPGCIWMANGDPGYPPEGSEDREFVAATIREHGSKEEVRLPDDVGRKLFAMYEQQIDDVGLDYETEDDRE